MKIILIRHGQTQGNLEKRYIGRTDEALCQEGIDNLLRLREEGIYPKADKVFISPMERCRETAELLYPGMAYETNWDLRECDFGEFENKNYMELSGNPNYQKWVDSMGTLPFPEGESSMSFKERCRKGYQEIINENIKLIENIIQNDNVNRDENKNHKEKNLLEEDNELKSIAFIIHGGTIMSILEEYAKPQKDFYHWQVGNGEGYLCNLMDDHIHLEVIKKLEKVSIPEAAE